MARTTKAKFTEKLFEDICEGIATSNKGLLHVCRANNVSSTMFYKWLRKDDKLVERYIRAREDQADFLADEIIEIADDSSDDIEVGEDGRPRLNAEFVARSRLRVEARKWTAAKLKPTKYGENSSLDIKVTKVGKDKEGESYE